LILQYLFFSPTEIVYTIQLPYPWWQDLIDHIPKESIFFFYCRSYYQS